MIALLLEDRCTACNRCVEVCPAQVFDARPVAPDAPDTPGAPPRVARPGACQTCFQCELYCKADALYVDPDCERLVGVERERAIEAGWLGQYRRESGWDEWADDPRYANEHWRMDEVFARGRAAAASATTAPKDVEARARREAPG